MVRVFVCVDVGDVDCVDVGVGFRIGIRAGTSLDRDNRTTDARGAGIGFRIESTRVRGVFSIVYLPDFGFCRVKGRTHLVDSF